MHFEALSNLIISPRHDEYVAFTSETKKTWSQFKQQVSNLTCYLLQCTEQRWALCCEDSYQFSVAFFALAYAGKEIVLPGNQQPAMLEQLSEQFDAFISDNLCVEIANKQVCALPFLSENKQLLAHSLAIEKVKLILFTSGSSGLPKAIEKNLSLLNAEITYLEAQWSGLLQKTQVVSTVSHQHIYGLLFRVLWPLCAGRAFQQTDIVYPEQLASYADQKYTLISSPALLKRLTEETKGEGFRAIFSSGGPLHINAANDCQVKLKQLPIEIFGSTETGGIGFRQQKNSTQPWIFFSGIEMQLDKLQCLAIKSPWLSLQTWYQTSDQCELLINRQFNLKGRVDRIVKIEEKRISLNEVEQRLDGLVWIDESAVLLLEQAHRANLVAVIKLSQQGINTMTTLGKGKFWIFLRQQLRRWIEPVAVPRYFRVVNQIAVNKQGKRSLVELETLFKKE